ncbi:hypothetical protein BKK51_09415 [Rodentibacter trehalosifermentans]|uniref:Uncharacterized protein n=1 Tax=Rodentibacter trehalosifermentans TaxID=1908263 RepID=A0A1V3IPQ1_9PAST|nr:hypothetical protein [Rodentibacter trehalosifermentans]OOF44218.1 hypothetical protein BKK51_09415 [Rodentibacter trehalosifermentans]
MSFKTCLKSTTLFRFRKHQPQQLSGALSVGVEEIAANYLAQEVYQKDVRELTEDEKRNISALNQLTEAISSGLISAVGNENATIIVTNLSERRVCGLKIHARINFFRA